MYISNSHRNSAAHIQEKKSSYTAMPTVVYGYSSVITCGGSMRIRPLRMLDRKWRQLRNIRPSGAFFTGSDKVTWPEEALSGLTFFPHTFFPYFFVRTFCFPYFFFKFFPVLIPPPYFFSCIFFYRNFFPVLFFSTYFFSRIFFTVLFFPVLFSRTFSKVATFEIQRIKISVSCFFITCRYNTVHVPCRISIQTSPVGLPLDGWRARMRDLKGSKMNLFNLKEDWNVF